MTEPTYKQVAFASRLGIKNAEKYSKEELSQMIDQKVKPKERDFDAEVKEREELAYQNSSKRQLKPYEKDPVGLAVEVFMALQDEIPHIKRMELAITLVKQAQKAFE